MGYTPHEQAQDYHPIGLVVAIASAPAASSVREFTGLLDPNTGNVYVADSGAWVLKYAQYSQVLTVSEYGADPTGMTDCSTIINALITEKVPLRATCPGPTVIRFSRQASGATGVYKLTAAIEIAERSVAIVGDNARLEWAGSGADDMLRFRNCEFSTVNSLVLQGNSTTPPFAAIRFERDSATSSRQNCWNSVRDCQLRHVGGRAIQHLQNGVVFALRSGSANSNNDSADLNKVLVTGCTARAISVEHSQAMLHRFDAITVYNSDTALHTAASHITCDAFQVADVGTVINLESGVSLTMTSLYAEYFTRLVVGNNASLMVLNGQCLAARFGTSSTRVCLADDRELIQHTGGPGSYLFRQMTFPLLGSMRGDEFYISAIKPAGTLAYPVSFEFDRCSNVGTNNLVTLGYGNNDFSTVKGRNGLFVDFRNCGLRYTGDSSRDITRFSLHPEYLNEWTMHPMAATPTIRANSLTGPMQTVVPYGLKYTGGLLPVGDYVLAITALIGDYELPPAETYTVTLSGDHNAIRILGWTSVQHADRYRIYYKASSELTYRGCIETWEGAGAWSTVTLLGTALAAPYAGLQPPVFTRLGACIEVNGSKIGWITGTSAPTEGTWTTGDRVFRSDYAGTGVLGWICTRSGTSGETLSGVTAGYLPATGSLYLWVSDVSKFQPGDWISVAAGTSFSVKLAVIPRFNVATTINDADGVPIGATSLVLTSVAGIVPGDNLLIDKVDGTNREVVRVARVLPATNTVELFAATTIGHDHLDTVDSVCTMMTAIASDNGEYAATYRSITWEEMARSSQQIVDVAVLPTPSASTDGKVYRMNTTGGLYYSADYGGARRMLPLDGIYQETTVPTPAADHRGKQRYAGNASGTEDEWRVCFKDADDVYRWSVVPRSVAATSLPAASIDYAGYLGRTFTAAGTSPATLSLARKVGASNYAWVPLGMYVYTGAAGIAAHADNRGLIRYVAGNPALLELSRTDGAGNPEWKNILLASPAAAQADSTAATLADLVTDFNTLLGKLRTAGLLTP